jgi:hypothetical protein
MDFRRGNLVEQQRNAVDLWPQLLHNQPPVFRYGKQAGFQRKIGYRLVSPPKTVRMEWIKARERPPKDQRILNLRFTGDEDEYKRPLSGNYIAAGYFNTPLGRYPVEGMEYLDETAPESSTPADREGWTDERERLFERVCDTIAISDKPSATAYGTLAVSTLKEVKVWLSALRAATKTETN